MDRLRRLLGDGPDLIVSLNGGLPGAEQLTWGQDGFVSGANTLMFGTTEATANVHFTNDVQLVGNDHVQVTGNGTTTSSLAYLDGVLSGSGGLEVSGVNGGQLFLTAANTYTGDTTIDQAAKVSLVGAGAIASSSGLTDDGVLDISATNKGASLTTLSGSGVVNLGAQSLTLTQADGAFSGAINGAGGFHVASGDEALLGANGYTGVTTIDGPAVLILAQSGTIASSAGVVDNGLLDISPAINGATITTLSGAGEVYLGAETLTLSKAADTFSGGVFGSGGVHVAGGDEVLTGFNGYTGATTVDQGAELALARGGSIAASSRVVDNGVFDISATVEGASITTLAGSGTLQLGTERLTLSKASDTFSGKINGSGVLHVKAGGEILAGSNSYTGATIIDPMSALALAGAGSIASSSGVLDNGLFDISATTNGASIATLSGEGVVNLGAETLALTQAANTFAGTIGGTGALHVAAGTETLTGLNGYTGAGQGGCDRPVFERH